MKNKTTAAILAIFLGGIGVHRFYLNQIGLGFLYLLFCWTLIPSLIALIDFIIFLSMDDEKFNMKYNPNYVMMMHQAARPQKDGMNNAIQLEKWHELKEKGIITEEEFNRRKAKLC